MTENKNDGYVQLRNPHIEDMESDNLYHIALNSADQNFQEMFSDVKFVCTGGTADRMEKFAKYAQKQLNIQLPVGAALYDISASGKRYSMYKIGPIISVNHGMGVPSLSILLHELIKLMHHAKCKDVVFLRLGTCGGIGIPPGSIVISNEAVDGLLKANLELHILGKKVYRPAILDQTLANDLKQFADKEIKECQTFFGKTMCANDFYEGQGRLDGAFCDYTMEDKLNYLKHLQSEGVTNIEMESVAFAAMCHHAGISGGIICVAIVDRLQGDQIDVPKEEMDEWHLRPMKLAVEFIKHRLNMSRK